MRKALAIAAVAICAAMTAGSRAEPAGLVLPINRPLCGQTAGTPAASSPVALRVATFNTLHGLSESPGYPTHSTFDARLDLQVAEIVAEEIDVLGMQEVSLTEDPVDHAPGLVVERLANGLTAATGEAWYWCWHLSNPHFPIEPDIAEGGGGPLTDVMASMASSNYGSFKEGAAVLSRYPIAAAEGRRLPHRIPLEPLLCPIDEIPDCPLTAIFDHRIALWARVDTPGGATDIIATHFVHGLTPLSDASAFNQAAVVHALSEEMAHRHGEPAQMFITCDCNATTSDTPDVVGLITSLGWTDTYSAAHPGDACGPGESTAGCTSDQDILASAPTTTERIDYVFARAGSRSLDLLASERWADTAYPAATSTGFLFPSDHLAVWTDIGLDGY